MRRLVKRRSETDDKKSDSWLWHRPSRFVAGCVGLFAATVGWILQSWGARGAYFETAFTGLIVLWCLLSAFRSEWRRSRFWVVVSVISGLHIFLWLYLERRSGHIGFALMFVVVVLELVLGATAVVKTIPEDQQIMGEQIRRW